MKDNDFQKEVLKKLYTLWEDVSWLKKDVSWLKKDMAWVKKDVSWLKEDVSWLKEDVSWLKEDVSWLKEDVSWLKEWQIRIEKKLQFQWDLLYMKTDEIIDQVNLNRKYTSQAFEKISDTLDHGERISLLEQRST